MSYPPGDDDSQDAADSHRARSRRSPEGGRHFPHQWPEVSVEDYAAVTKTERIEAYWQEFAKARGAADADYTAFAFGDGPELADSLLALVIGGDKRATAGLARDYSGDEPMPKPGDYWVVLDGAGGPGCIIRTKEVVLKPLSAADEAFAWDEGEGDRSLAWWMDAHVRFFRRQADAESFEFSKDLDTMFERFEVVWPERPATVRPETPADVDAVRALTTEAFAASDLGHTGEADIVDAVRAAHPSDIVSLVAESDDAVVGHILFSPVIVGDARGMGLAPMAVAPAHQGKRVGAELVRAGLRALRDRGCLFVVVLGHPHYYPRFGFRPAAAHGIECEFDGVPTDAFMILSLDHSVRLPRGVARYVPQLRGKPEPLEQL